jgi:uncharacterized protein YbaR (Trm112 family)
MPIDAEFLQMLACPACRGELMIRGDDRLYCAACHRSYPVRDDIPILLLEEALVEKGEAPGASAE